MRISDWSSDVCSSDLEPWHKGRSPQQIYAFLFSTLVPLSRSRSHARAPPRAVRSCCRRAPSHRPRRGRERRTARRRARRSEEHTSELQSLMRNSYAVFCLKKKKNKLNITQCNMIESLYP